MINNLYIDNVFLTFDDQQKIIQSYEQFRIFSKVMMNVHKFISNSEKIEFQALNRFIYPPVFQKEPFIEM